MEFEHKVGALDDEDLVVGDKEERNWKGIVISLVVIGFVLSGIIISINLLTPSGDVDINKMKLDFEHVVSEQFKVQGFNGTWLSDHEIVYVDQNGSIVIFDAETNKSSSMLVKTYDKTLHTMDGFTLSADRQSILFVSDMRYEFGAPISARYAIFNISGQTVEFLDDLIKVNFPARTPHVQSAAWGPSSNSIVFIESNDIYFLPDFVTYQPGGPRLLRLTRTGSISGSISNGLPDSLYRHNIFASSRGNNGAELSGAGAANTRADVETALWWSPDGRYLAYLTFDDFKVEPSPIEFYDSYLHDSNNNPRIHYERYPRAGGILPQVSVHVADLAASLAGSDEPVESSVLEPPAELSKQLKADERLGHYVTYVGWLSPSRLLVMRSNRAQNSSLLSQCETSGSSSSGGGGLFGGGSSRSLNLWRCELLASFTQRLPPSVGAAATILPTYNANGTRLIFFALPRPDSLIGDHFHVAMLRGEERAPKYLTHGQFDVARLLTYDPHSDSLYFEATVSESAERHLYKLSSINQLAARQTTCLTCQLDEPCGYNLVHLAKGPAPPRYLVHECLGPSIPVTRMRSIAAAAATTNGGGGGGGLLPSRYVLNTNQQIESLVRSKQMPIEKFIAIKANQQAPYDVHIKLYLPNEIEEEKDKRFPLLIESSDIDKRNVWKKFELDWGKYLASRKQLIYAKIDCIRSTRSASLSAGGANQPSPLESQQSQYHEQESASGQVSGDSQLFNSKDQMDVIKFLVENVDLFPYIDRRRIAIWGPSSTSAYVALATTMNDDAKLIQCTVAVAPITNWRYMNAYAAEHYLGLPWLDSNSLKYERANLLKRNYEFSMRKLLIVHGTADEQVHVQHSMQFIKALSEHHMVGGVIHQMQLYPDVDHSLELVKKHFYLTLDGFVDRCFYQKPITIKATEWKGKVRPKLY